ncbi:MAG: type II secretion system protein [Armatimonadota bacterium]
MWRSSRALALGGGLTLVELLITVAIIAVLAGIIYAALGPVRERGRQMVCISNLHRLQMALLAYRTDYGGS